MTSPIRIALLLVGLGSAASTLVAQDSRGFSVTVLVDGRAAPEYAARGRIYVEALKGKDFVIRLFNPTSERIAVALSVDGRNVIDAKRTTEMAATKWILGPWQTADIPGWQMSGQTARKFFFTETASSYAKWLGDTSNVGTIEAVFFREKRRVPILREKKDEARVAPEEIGQAPYGVEGGVAGGVAGGVESNERPAGKATAEAPLAAPEPSRRQKAAEADRFAATGIGDQTRFPVEWVDFEEDPHPFARVAIRYEFREQLVRLGVLPREDELFARERSRGFEHGYAPDPYRHR
jgi:hypothetical protein